jgi:protein-tyrosine phosphatase
MGIVPINSVGEFEDIVSHDDDYDAVVIDLRPFNQYSISRVEGSLSICVPTTLLKRNSFHLANIFKTMVSPQDEVLQEKINSDKGLKVIFYDASSTVRHCSPHLYQIIKKFQESTNDHPKTIELYVVDGGFTMFEGSSLTDSTKFMNANAKEGTSSGFSMFRLPSADPVSSFVMSLKKNTMFPDTHGTKLDVPEFETLDQFPKWLQPYASKDSVASIVNNFKSIESMENARIGGILQRRSSQVSTNSQSPDVQLQGSEFGFKNRYPNILPYEHSRVRLVPSPMSSAGTPPNVNNLFFRTHSTASLSPNSAISAKRGDDYFNANFLSVPLINDDVHYIATQAPLPSTIQDFWKVVWHNNTEVIISLTNLDENGMKKSDVYWNNSSCVELMYEEDNYSGFENLTLRRIQLTRRGKSRVIHQLHFKAWPDFGVVEYKDLLRLISVKDKIVNDRSAPIVVHCSAGCGRTGVFITIDLLIEAFKRRSREGVDHNRIDIWETEEDLINFTVQTLRKQRISMVQSLDQFVLCYQAMLQYFVSK